MGTGMGMGMGMDMGMDTSMSMDTSTNNASAISTLKEKEFSNDYDDMLVMTYLATLAKTANAVVGYADKFRVVEEGKQNSKLGSMGTSMGIVGGSGSGSGGGSGSGSGS
eukprot:252250_1